MQGEGGLRRSSVSVRLHRRREMAQTVRDGCALDLADCRESQAGPGHEVRVAPELPLPSNHCTPDHLGREAQRPARRREVQGAGCPGSEEVEVLDLRAGDAEVEKADVSEATDACARPLDQSRACYGSPFLSLDHRSPAPPRSGSIYHSTRGYTPILEPGAAQSLCPPRHAIDGHSVNSRRLLGLPLTYPPPPTRCARHTPCRTLGPPHADGPFPTSALRILSCVPGNPRPSHVSIGLLSSVVCSWVARRAGSQPVL